MTIGRVTSDLGLYSQQRLDVFLHGRPTGRQPPPSSEGGNAASRHARQNYALSVTPDAWQRPPPPEADEDDGKVVPFEQPGTAADQQPGYGNTAEESLLALEVGNPQRDALLAQAALVYVRSGRAGSAVPAGMVGTQLNAVA